MTTDNHNLEFLKIKGGTCLNKVYVGFYRLSEDLDFSIPMDLEATRSKRRNAMVAVKRQFTRIESALPAIKIAGALTPKIRHPSYFCFMDV